MNTVLLILMSIFLSSSINILITGGTGYIGSHTAVTLLKAGYNVTLVDNLENSKVSVVESIEKITGIKPTFIYADCTNETSVKPVFSSTDFDAVIHMAGYKSVSQSIQQPLQYYHNNIQATITILKMMELFKVNKLIFSSSATVYGNTSKQGYKETDDTGQGMTNPYGRTKYMIEEILKDVAVAHPYMDIVILRYFNPVGAHKTGMLGEDPNGIPNNLMPVITNVYRGKLKKLQIFGRDYPTPDGTCIRDYIHVMDLAAGHMAALRKQGRGLSIFNLGSGTGTSVSQLVSLFERISQKRLPKEYVDRRTGDLPCVYANPQKAWNELGWKTELTMSDAIADTLTFIHRNTDISEL